jgi:hypothetical protein
MTDVTITSVINTPSDEIITKTELEADYVPYTGATADVDLGEYGITASTASIGYGQTVNAIIADGANGIAGYFTDGTAIVNLAYGGSIGGSFTDGTTTVELATYQGANFAVYATGDGYFSGNITTGGNIELGNASDTTLARDSGGVMSVEGVVIPSISSTNTLTNKRITPRVGSTTSSATPTINTDNYDAYSITALAANITSMTTNLSGTPTNFQKLLIRIKDDGSDRTIAWGASFQDGSVALPTTTIAGKTLLVGLIYDSVDSKWTCEASGSRA